MDFGQKSSFVGNFGSMQMIHEISIDVINTVYTMIYILFHLFGIGFLGSYTDESRSVVYRPSFQTF